MRYQHHVRGLGRWGRRRHRGLVETLVGQLVLDARHAPVDFCGEPSRGRRRYRLIGEDRGWHVLVKAAELDADPLVVFVVVSPRRLCKKDKAGGQHCAKYDNRMFHTRNLLVKLWTVGSKRRPQPVAMLQ